MSTESSNGSAIVGRPFPKGVSGNPGGRPKDQVRALAREYTQEALEKLVSWMRSENAKASVSACIAILDRGWGKCPQSVNLTGEEGGPLEITVRMVHADRS